MEHTMYDLYWLSSEGTDELPGGAYECARDAHEAAMEWLRELVAECTSEADQDGILAGEFSWRDERWPARDLAPDGPYPAGCDVYCRPRGWARG